MKKISISFYKSLLSFVTSFIGPLAYKTFTNQSMPLFDLDPIQHPADVDTSGRSGLSNTISQDIYSSFLWFIATMAILEIAILASSLLKKNSAKTLNWHTDILQHTSKDKHGMVAKIPNFIIYVVEIVCLSSLYYCLFMSITVVVSLAWNLCFHKNNTLKPHQGVFQDQLPLRNLQAIYPPIVQMPQSYSSNGLGSTSLSSPFVDQYFQIMDGDSNQAIISSDGNTAFIVAGTSSEYDSDFESCTFQILNITNKSSPSFIGSVFFNGPIESIGPLEISADESTIFMGASPYIYIINVSNLSVPESLSTAYSAFGDFESFEITPDGQTLVIATYYATLQFINISNLSSPTNISSYNASNIAYDYLYFDSLMFSADSKTAFLITNIGETLYDVETLNISDLQSPQMLNNISFYANSYSLNVNQDTVYLQYNEYLAILNISDLTEPILANLSDLIPGENILGATFAPDFQTVYVEVGPDSDFEEEITEDYIQILTISNNNNVSLAGKINGTVASGITIPSNSSYIYFIEENFSLRVVDVSVPTSPISLPLAMIQTSSISSASISPDGRTLLTKQDNFLFMLQLNINIQANQPFFFLNDPFATIIPNNSSQLTQIALSPDGNTLFVIDDGECAIFDVSNPYAYVQLPPLNATGVPFFDVEKIQVSPDGKYLLVAFELGQLDIFDIESLQLVQNLSIPGNYSQTAYTLSPNGNNIYFIDNLQDLLIWEIAADQSSITMISNLTFAGWEYTKTVTLSGNGNIAFIGGSGLLIYNVSIPSSPGLLANYSDVGEGVIAVTLSSDETVAFVLTFGAVNTDQCILIVIDISIITNPTFITSMTFPNFIYGESEIFEIELLLGQTSPTTQLLFVPTSMNLAVLNVTLPESPTLFAYYPMQAASYAISPDNTTLYFAYPTNISLVSMNTDDILYLDSLNFTLGAPYTDTLTVFTRDPGNTYNAMLTNYKFTNLAFYVPTMGAPYYSPLPSWIDFDTVSGSITFSPDSQSQIGDHYFYGAISMQIPNNTFNGVGSINNTNDSLSLLVSLISLGYVDNGLFLTSSFNPTQPMILGPQYLADEPLIRSNLANYYVEAMTTISVTQSLQLTWSEPNVSMSVSTLSLSPLNIIITLLPNNNSQQQPQFVSTGYSFIASYSDNNSTVTMVGSLVDINNALSQLIVYLDGSYPCDGNVTITDSLNPTLSQIVPNMSQYFKINSQPQINTTYLQNQLSKISPETGNQFFIQFASSTFTDFNNQELTLSIQMLQSDLQVPDWLELKGLTLTGIPPMQLTGREIPLKLIVSNQYQSSEANFTLEIGISLEYALQMIGKYGGILITIIGLIAYASTIYNIFGKRFYTYPKEFEIQVGQEIDSKTLYPIAFAAEVLFESRIIMAHIDHKIAREINDKAKARIASYFTSSHNSYQIDKARLTQEIEEVATELSLNDKTRLKLYTPLTTSQKDLINQVIINNFIVRLLDLKGEETTKAAFEKIKESIFSFIELERCLPDGVCLFSVNRASLHSKLRSLNLKTFSPSEKKEEGEAINSSGLNENSELEHNQTQSVIESPLMGKGSATRPISSVNIDLLINVIEAYAFNSHILDEDLINVNIVVRQRLANVWRILDSVRRFLKRDLQVLGMNGKGLVSFGIIDKIQERSIEFSGTANNRIKDQTLVLQIVNIRGRILRELRIYGIDACPEKEALSEQVL